MRTDCWRLKAECILYPGWRWCLLPKRCTWWYGLRLSGVGTKSDDILDKIDTVRKGVGSERIVDYSLQWTSDPGEHMPSLFPAKIEIKIVLKIRILKSTGIVYCWILIPSLLYFEFLRSKWKKLTSWYCTARRSTVYCSVGLYLWNLLCSSLRLVYILDLLHHEDYARWNDFLFCPDF